MNLFEFPIWQQENKWLVWKNQKGYVYKTAYKATAENDYLFLVYLLLKHQQQKSDEEQFLLTRYQILKDCGFNLDQRNYQRLEDSLKR